MAIYSIGHGGRTVPGLLQALVERDIAYLIDVRSAPYSRYQPGFSKRPLETALRHSPVAYVFMGDILGGRPRDPALYSDGHVDYDKCRRSDSFLRGLARLQNAHDQGLAVCLLCAEAKPERCHRTLLIGAALHDHNITVQHILADGSALSQTQLMDRAQPVQLSLPHGD